MQYRVFGWKTGKTTAFVKTRINGRPALFSADFPKAVLTKEQQREELAACVRDVQGKSYNARHWADKPESAK